MTDERLNKSSGSKFSIDAACPGNQNLINSMTEEQRNAAQPDDPLASRGIRLHAAWQKDSIEGLEDEEEIADFEKGKRYVESAISQWAQDNGLPEFKEAEREQRFWMHNPDDLTPVLSGQIDKYLTSGRHAIVLDFKSGWTKNLPPSHQNWQLRCYAVLLWKEHPELERIRVGFVKPKTRADAADYTDYSLSDLQHSEREIHHILWRTKQPDAPRVAGPQCNFCIGKAYCDQAGAMSLLPTTIIRDIKSSELSPEQIAERMSPQDLVAVWSRSTVIVKILDAIKDRLKGLPVEELSALGMQLKDGRKMDKITNAQGCLFYLRDELKLSEEAIWEAMSFGKGDVVLAIMRDLGTAKPKALGVAKQIIERFGTTSEASKTLEKIN